MNLMAVKENLHRLVDELPETELKAAQRFLEYLRDSQVGWARPIFS